jgi:hypothetical protein
METVDSIRCDRWRAYKVKGAKAIGLCEQSQNTVETVFCIPIIEEKTVQSFAGKSETVSTDSLSVALCAKTDGAISGAEVGCGGVGSAPPTVAAIGGGCMKEFAILAIAPTISDHDGNYLSSMRSMQSGNEIKF